MTVAALTETRAQISGDGVTDRVDLTFQFVDEADLRLIHTDGGGTDTEWVFQQSPGNWSFSGGDYSAGTIHFTASDLAVGERLTVILTSQYDQMLSLDGGEIDPSVLERGMDKAALQIQSIAGEVRRALRISPSLSGSLPDLEVPDLPDGHTFVREGDVLVPALLDSNSIAASVAAAQTAQTGAETAESNAANSATSAASSKTAAATSATSAAGSATDAGDYATSAGNSATAAGNSATAAATSASSASSSKAAAETSASNASSSASSASSSASSASSSASSASSSASSASGSASSAGSSATAAGNSATAAAGSASSAASSASAAAMSAAEAAASASGEAEDISFTATDNLSSDNVQDALEELDSEKASASSVAALQWTWLARQTAAHEFTGIPDSATEIEIIFTIASGSTTGWILITIGDSGGLELTNYTCEATRFHGGIVHQTYTTGFIVFTHDASVGFSGTVRLVKTPNGTNEWSFEASANANDKVVFSHGFKSLSGVLDRIEVSRTGGVFDGGHYDVRYK